MSAASVTHSPRQWLPDSPRRRPAATSTVPPPAALTTTKHSADRAIKTVLLEGGISAGTMDAVNNALVRNMSGAQGSGKISFAPGTTFYDRTRLRSRGSSKKVPPNFNLRPVTSEGKSHHRFTLPKATLPSLHYLSVSHEDFLDPRYAEDIVKSYGIPKYFFKSKSNLLLSSAGKQRRKPVDGGGGGAVGHKESEDGKTTEAARLEREADDLRPKTSDSSAVTVPRLSNRLPIVVPVATTTSDHTKGPDNDHSGAESATASGSLPQMLPLYKPLIGEKYTHARFFPPMNPFRSLQMESEVTKYVEHKKRVGLGRYVRHAEKDNPPSSGLVREASMYDLNNQGPVDRPLDQFLPPPERKPFLRQRPRDPKNEPPRPSENSDLVILPRERTATERSSVNLKDMVK